VIQPLDPSLGTLCCAGLEASLADRPDAPAAEMLSPEPEQHPAALFRSIVINANDVVLVTEAEPLDLASGGPRVIYVNPAFTRMTGYEPEDILGRTPRVLQSPKTDRRELDRLRRALKRWEPVEVELLNVHKDGTEFWVQINITPVCDETGWWTHWIAVQRDITARKSREIAVQKMLDNASDLMFVVAGDGAIASLSPSAAGVLGYEPAFFVERQISDLTHVLDQARLEQLLAGDSAVRLAGSSAVEIRLRRQDGSWLWVEAVASDMGEVSPDASLLVCVDITARRRAEAELQASNDQFRSAFDDAPIGMAMTESSGQIVLVNAALCDLLGYTEAALLQMTVQEITHPEDVESGRRQRAELLAGTATRHQHETRFISAPGDTVGVLHSSSIVADGEGRPRHLIDHIEDITERKNFERDLRYQALHDTLTGLPTRALLTDRLQQALNAGERSKTSVALIFLDLDRFKLINDSFGHQAGDQVLVNIAQRLTAVLRPEDTASRLSGDEFVVLCHDSSPERAAVTAAGLAAVFDRPISINGTAIKVGASIGVAVSRPGRTTADSLLKDADDAMYSAKDGGRGRIAVFDAVLGNKIQARIQLEAELRHGISMNELRAYYQPEIDLIDGRTVALEALVRWQHSQKGLMAPAEFIGVAEDTGLISALGDWVLNEALQEVARRRLASPDLVMWVNLSAHQIQDPALVDTVARALRKYGLPGAALGLEITESVLMRDFDASRQTLLALKAMDVSLAIDDFGTGYSSLSYLARFPVDIVKIDRYFTSGLDDPERRRESFAIISAVIGLAHALGLRVVAEGIETSSQAQTLHGLGCDHGQGFFFGRPAPAPSGPVRSRSASEVGAGVPVGLAHPVAAPGLPS
jgi:diguanylate cyclase (GGDEF)-like protein/PAS domain S-box-containing protein